MKTNEEKAAAYGYYKLSDIPEHVMNDEYFKEHWADFKEAGMQVCIPEGLKGAEVYARVKEETGGNGEHELYYVEYYNVLIFSAKTDIPLFLRNTKGKYYFYPAYEAMTALEGDTGYEQRKPYLAELKEPSYIGAFTDKKVEAWIDYCITLMEAHKKASTDLESKKASNLKRINDVVEKLGADAKVWNYRNGKYIETAHFDIILDLENNGEYLKQTINYKGDIDDLIKLEKCYEKENCI